MNDTATTVRLSNCPFCGGEPRLCVHGQMAWVECVKCSARGPLHHREAGAAEKWNERGGVGSMAAALQDTLKVMK